MLGHFIKDEDGVKRPVGAEDGSRVSAHPWPGGRVPSTKEAASCGGARATELGLAGRVDGADKGTGSGSPATPSLALRASFPCDSVTP